MAPHHGGTKTASTRLGGEAFSHSQSSDAEAEYDRLRGLAHQEFEKMGSCFDRAHQAYESHDGAQAHELSEEGKKHKAKGEDYNRQASEFILRENNAADRVESDTIDLHGQFVEEAEDILEKRIRTAKAQNQTHLHVIVGKGNHSPDHIQKIKPAVEKICREEGLQYRTEENEGRIYVNLTGGSAASPPPAPQTQKDKKQHGSRPQQPQQQSQPQPQQQFETTDTQKKDEGLIGALKACCVIM